MNKFTNVDTESSLIMEIEKYRFIVKNISEMAGAYLIDTDVSTKSSYSFFQELTSYDLPESMMEMLLRYPNYQDCRINLIALVRDLTVADPEVAWILTKTRMVHGPTMLYPHGVIDIIETHQWNTEGILVSSRVDTQSYASKNIELPHAESIAA